MFVQQRFIALLVSTRTWAGGYKEPGPFSLGTRAGPYTQSP